MSAAFTTGLWALVLGSGVMAGVYFTFSSFVMASLAAIPTPQGIVAMQSINRVILSSLFMPLFFATSAASAGLVVWGALRWGQPGAMPLVAGGVIYLVGMFVCTAAFNVPLNNALDVVDPTSPQGAHLWSDYQVSWTRWNHLRTACSVVACALFVAAARDLA